MDSAQELRNYYQTNLGIVEQYVRFMSDNYETMTQDRLQSGVVEINRILNDLSNVLPETQTLLPEVLPQESDDLHLTDEEYKQFLSLKNKPKLSLKKRSCCIELSSDHECVICFDNYSFCETVILGCGHKFCNECISSHFHHSLLVHPTTPHFLCPYCRGEIKKVIVNFTSNIAKNKKTASTTPIAAKLKTWCKYKY